MRETKVDWSRSLAGTTSKAEPPFLVDQEDKRRRLGAGPLHTARISSVESILHGACKA